MSRGVTKGSADIERRGLISRSIAARLLGVSRSAVRTMDGVHLTPKIEGGAVYYYKHDIDALLSIRSGAAAQQAFNVFAAGGGPTDAVIQHALPPELCQRLWQVYLRLKRDETSALVIELPKQLSAEAWRRAHGYDVITPEIVRSALELCARRPELRGRLRASQPRE